jgi:hypothetical protein
LRLGRLRRRWRGSGSRRGCQVCFGNNGRAWWRGHLRFGGRSWHANNSRPRGNRRFGRRGCRLADWLRRRWGRNGARHLAMGRLFVRQQVALVVFRTGSTYQQREKTHKSHEKAPVPAGSRLYPLAVSGDSAGRRNKPVNPLPAPKKGANICPQAGRVTPPSALGLKRPPRLESHANTRR